MDLGATLVAMSPFLMVVAIVALAMWSSNSSKRAVQQTIREVVRSGQDLSPETIKALGAPQKKGDENGDLKSGLILIAIAAAIAVLGVAVGQVADPGDAEQALPVMLAVAAFPGFIGVVLVFFGLFNGRKRNNEGEPS